MRVFLGFLAFGIALAGCKARSLNTQAETRTIRQAKAVSSVELPDRMLGFAKANNIPHKVYKDTVNPNAFREERRHVIRIVFENLTETHYRLLMDHYGGQNLVPYSNGRNFELVDFLPPKIQALVGKWLIPTTEEDKTIPVSWRDPRNAESLPKVSIGMGCWSLAYEVLRDLGKPLSQLTGKIVYFSAFVADNILGDKKAQALEQPLLKTAWAPDKVVERNKGRKLGDLLWIKTRLSLFGPSHAALWIDDDLFFEKANYSGEEPMRLAFFEDVTKSYVEDDLPTAPTTMKFIRYKSGSLPEPSSLAGKFPYAADGIVPSENLSPEAKKTLIFFLDAGLAGSLSNFSVQRILTFPIKQDPTTNRAIYEGADNLKNFLRDDTLCVDSFWEGTYRYRIDAAFNLYVMSKAGATVATIKGKPLQNKKENGRIIFAEFPSGDKVLKLQESEQNGVELFHPGITTGTELPLMDCKREPATWAF